MDPILGNAVGGHWWVLSQGLCGWKMLGAWTKTWCIVGGICEWQGRMIRKLALSSRTRWRPELGGGWKHSIRIGRKDRFHEFLKYKNLHSFSDQMEKKFQGGESRMAPNFWILWHFGVHLANYFFWTSVSSTWQSEAVKTGGDRGVFAGMYLLEADVQCT